MPLIKTELLIPRVLCIGGKEGEPNYPGSRFMTGDIIEQNGRDYWSIKADAWLNQTTVKKFPHLFQPLQWWYGRTVEEMPRYVNTNSVYGIRKVKEWAFIKGEKLDRWRVEDTRGEIYSTFHLDITPADESEYQEYQKQKQ